MGWSVCRTRSETAVKALRAQGWGRGLEALVLEQHCAVPWLPLLISVSARENVSLFFFLAKDQIKLSPSFCLLFPEHLKKRIS